MFSVLVEHTLWQNNRFFTGNLPGKKFPEFSRYFSWLPLKIFRGLPLKLALFPVSLVLTNHKNMQLTATNISVLPVILVNPITKFF
jgi:hypothetical protein